MAYQHQNLFSKTQNQENQFNISEIIDTPNSPDMFHKDILKPSIFQDHFPDQKHYPQETQNSSQHKNQQYQKNISMNPQPQKQQYQDEYYSPEGLVPTQATFEEFESNFDISYNNNMNNSFLSLKSQNYIYNQNQKQQLQQQQILYNNRNQNKNSLNVTFQSTKQQQQTPKFINDQIQRDLAMTPKSMISFPEFAAQENQNQNNYNIIHIDIEDNSGHDSNQNQYQQQYQSNQNDKLQKKNNNNEELSWEQNYQQMQMNMNQQQQFDQSKPQKFLEVYNDQMIFEEKQLSSNNKMEELLKIFESKNNKLEQSILPQNINVQQQNNNNELMFKQQQQLIKNNYKNNVDIDFQIIEEVSNQKTLENKNLKIQKQLPRKKQQQDDQKEVISIQKQNSQQRQQKQQNSKMQKKIKQKEEEKIQELKLEFESQDNYSEQIFKRSRKVSCSSNQNNINKEYLTEEEKRLKKNFYKNICFAFLSYIHTDKIKLEIKEWLKKQGINQEQFFRKYNNKVVKVNNRQTFQNLFFNHQSNNRNSLENSLKQKKLLRFLGVKFCREEITSYAKYETKIKDFDIFIGYRHLFMNELRNLHIDS